MSYSGTLVYFPPSTSFAAVRDALAAQVSSLTAMEGQLLAAFDDDKVIRVSHDTASHVPDEAKELAGRAEPAVAAVLAGATHRFEITPHDPSADPDDVYNELLRVFEALRSLPNAVGMDPFDGQLYLDAPVTSPPRASAKTAAERPTKATVKRPTKTAAKRPTKAAAKRPTKTAAKRPTKTAAKTAAKRPTKTAAKRPTKAAVKRPTKTAAKRPTKAKR